MQDNFVQIHPGDLADSNENIFDTLARRIALARDEMIRCGIEANTVVLDSFKFGKLIRPEYVPTIFGMKVELAPLPDEYDFLVQYQTPKFLTNGDRIRRMSDEDLARWIATDYSAPHCPYYSCQTDGLPGNGCEMCWLKWLKETKL